jgi:hypothetical protein
LIILIGKTGFYRRLLILKFFFMKHPILLFLFVIVTGIAVAQSANAPLNSDYYHLIDRLELKHGRFSGSFHSVVKPFQRIKIASFLEEIDQKMLNERDKFNLDYLANDNWEYMSSVDNESRRPVWNTFYRVKSDFFHVQEEDFDLHVNPVLYLGTGRESGNDAIPFQNTRGAEIRGIIGNRVGFYTFLGENQANLPSHVNGFVNQRHVIPGEGFWKSFKENGVDYFTARGYISFDAIKEINVQFGYDKMYLGDGYRSMLLSDFSNNYLFLKLNTKVWRINYTNLFTKMTAEALGTPGGSSGVMRYPSKYISLHHLSINITDHFNMGFFEAIVFGTPDENGIQHYDLSYLNPIIFYRAMEHQNGSIDNAVLGANFRWIVTRNYLLYGQLILDEFRLDKVGTGWWANKYGTQLGIKNVDFLGIENLDLQLETNWARPYTYTHSDIYTNYAHYNQPLAHPLGANFKEYLAILRYQPFKRLTLEGKFINMHYGADTGDSNWGGNILLPYTYNLPRSFDNKLGQGIGTDVSTLGFMATYQAAHNLFFDLTQSTRRFENQLGTKENSTLVNLALRWNVPVRRFDF